MTAFINRDYTLNHPDLLPVGLGPDRVLCKEQVLELNGNIEDRDAQYVWLKDGLVYATTASAQLIEPGTYTLTITDGDGCTNSDNITIARDETQIEADFVVATRVPVNERVRISNISNPAPDDIAWIVPPGATVLDEQEEYIELSFSQYGEYSVGLRSSKGFCERTEYKKVSVVSRNELADYATPDEPYIKQFVVTPNPTDGKFTATVELREAGDFKLIFYSNQGNVITEKEVKRQPFSTVDFDVSSSVSSGMGMLQLVTAEEVAAFKVMIR